jgi:hypothetical protein
MPSASVPVVVTLLSEELSISACRDAARHLVEDTARGRCSTNLGNVGYFDKMHVDENLCCIERCRRAKSEKFGAIRREPQGKKIGVVGNFGQPVLSHPHVFLDLGRHKERLHPAKQSQNLHTACTQIKGD